MGTECNFGRLAEGPKDWHSWTSHEAVFLLTFFSLSELLVLSDWVGGGRDLHRVK